MKEASRHPPHAWNRDLF